MAPPLEGPHGNLNVVKRVACWLMLFCLTLVQAHSLVPHHHHNTDDHAALHIDSTLVPDAGHFSSHHEMAPHDEAFLGVELKFKPIALDIAIPTLPSEVIVSAGQLAGALKVASRPDHPPSHGPPQLHDSRGPPASPVA